MSEQSQPKEVRISASDIVGVLNKILKSIDEQNKLVQTQNGILAALLKTATGGSNPIAASRPQAKPSINPSQLGYPGMSGGGKQHVPGQLTGLEPPQWTGESQELVGGS